MYCRLRVPQFITNYKCIMHSYNPKNDTLNLRIAQNHLENVTTHQLIVPEMGATQGPPLIYQVFITKYHLLIEKYKRIKVLNQF